jgi:hypothetical protein
MSMGTSTLSRGSGQSSRQRLPSKFAKGMMMPSRRRTPSANRLAGLCAASAVVTSRQTRLATMARRTGVSGDTRLI